MKTIMINEELNKDLVPNKLFKSSEVAKMLGITPATLKTHWKLGLIDAVIINTHRYYTMDAIKKYLDDGKRKGISTQKKD